MSLQQRLDRLELLLDAHAIELQEMRESIQRMGITTANAIAKLNAADVRHRERVDVVEQAIANNRRARR